MTLCLAAHILKLTDMCKFDQQGLSYVKGLSETHLLE